MRKIIESTLVSADGVVSDPPLWAMEYRDAEVTDEALKRLADTDAMLMGKGTYELFSAIWPSQAGDFADKRCNLTAVDLVPVGEDEETVRAIIEKHAATTGSPRGQWVLENWAQMLPKFVKVYPRDLRALAVAPVKEVVHA